MLLIYSWPSSSYCGKRALDYIHQFLGLLFIPSVQEEWVSFLVSDHLNSLSLGAGSIGFQPWNVEFLWSPRQLCSSRGLPTVRMGKPSTNTLRHFHSGLSVFFALIQHAIRSFVASRRLRSIKLPSSGPSPTSGDPRRSQCRSRYLIGGARRMGASQSRRTAATLSQRCCR